MFRGEKSPPTAGDKRPKFFYGYVVVATSFIIVALNWGASRTFGILIDPMLQEFGWTRASTSGAFTLCLITSGLLSIVAGRATDRFGPRIVLIICGFLLGAGYMLISQINAIWQLYLFFGVIVGAGMAGCSSPLMSLVARWFVKRRAMMSGIQMSSPPVGNIVLPLSSSLLITIYGWRASYLILGVTIMVLVVSSAQFLKRDPGSMGLLPYGADEVEVKNRNLQDEGFTLREALHTRQFWMLSILSFCHFFLTNVIAVHLVIYAIGKGLSPTSAAGMFSLSAGLALVGRIIVGAIADRVGNRRALIICYSTGVIAFLWLVAARELWMFYLFSFIFGLGNWSAPSIIAPLTAELFGLKHHGSIMAARNFIASIGGAVGPVAVGFIFDINNSYNWAFTLCATMAAIAVLSILLMKPKIRQMQKYTH